MYDVIHRNKELIIKMFFIHNNSLLRNTNSPNENVLQ